MENNGTISSVTSIASKGPDKAEQNDQQPSVSNDPIDATLPQNSDAVSHEDPTAAKEGSTQAKANAEAHPGSRDATSAESKNAGSTSSSGTQSYVPPVKRFSAVNINKKFLQKNQTSTTASGGASSASTSSKQPGTLARPAPQTAHTHSRLVTAKLTASPLSSSSTQGWSRPSSVTPPAPSPGSAAGPTKGPAPAISPAGSHSLPHAAPGGKALQPQVLKQQKSDGAGRPAWRSVQPGTTASALQAQKEFPTAAEAAQSLAKSSDGKMAPEAPDVHKQAMSETADAFRGVHLDPNAHHWDEEEDSDDYLGDVIEFGDGRQYTIHVSEEAQAETKPSEDNAGSVASQAPVNMADRFVDDFDRSWPKSRQEYGKEEPPRQRRPSRSDTAPSFPGHSPVSVRDGTQSRLLFNERLNRMEPISGGRPGPGSYGPGRGAQTYRDRPDGPGRFNSGRLERDAPPHSALRRPHDSPWGHPHGTEQHARDLRELKAEPTSYFHGEYHDRKDRSEWPSVRTQDGPSLNGRAFGSREPSSSRSINGAPSIASSDGHSSRYTSSIRDQHRGFPPGHHGDMDRQLPHLTRSVAPSEKSLGDADARPASEVDSVRDRDGPEHAPSTHPQFRADGSKVSSNDPEAIRKAFLHERAEAAKVRRQHEEEERMKAQERARKKAAELEAKIAAAAKAAEGAKDEPLPVEKREPVAAVPSPEVDKQKPTEAEVLRVIEGAISSAVPTEVPSNDQPNDPNDPNEPDAQKSSFAKALSRGESSRSVNARETQDSGQLKRPPPTTKADQAESWRAKSKPPILPVENSKNDLSQEPVVSVLPDVRAFDIQADESTEVVEFSDMSRLVTDRSQGPPSETDSTSVKPSRPVASDFFKGSVNRKPEQETWRKADTTTRRPYSTENGLGETPQQRPLDGVSEERHISHSNGEPGGQLTHPQAQPRSPVSQSNGVLPPSVSNQYSQSSPGGPRFLRSPHAPYREAPLAALDDTMSRIKGALDVMHSANEHAPRETTGPSTVRLPAPTSVPPRPSKWLPPALRQPGMASNNNRTDTFEPTHPEPPRSPAPPDNKAAIHLPSVSRRIEPLTKRQINYQKYFGPVRWEILSFDPPVEGMTKKSLSVNDVLFKRPQGPFKMRKYRVQLPKSSTANQRSPRLGLQGVDGNMISRTASQGAATEESKTEQSSWPSPNRTSLEDNGTLESRIAPTLDITSRSPPPELVTKTERVPTVSGVAIKHRTSQRSLDVTDVAFYRDVRGQTDGNVPTVTFTVGSELESQGDGSPSQKSLSSEPSKPSSSDVSERTASEVKPSSRLHQGATVTPPGKELPPSPLLKSARSESQAGGSVHSKAFEPQGDPFLQTQPVTPPPRNASSTWAKSPARAPDPEHLKAVWSQAPNNDTVPVVNSLKNIADDLPAVPFTLQEVKSEGGTPPPAPQGPVAPPTRMSASEVTRAFQTVPAGPSNGVGSSGLRGNHIPSSMGSPIGAQRALKPPTIGLPPPPSVNTSAPRPPYMGCPTSATNHSPSPPTFVYSHVMPNGMAGSPGSPYGQPMWMPVVQQGQQMLRPQSSAPYSPSLMPFSVPAAQNGMYPPSSMANAQGSPAAYPSAPLPSGMMVSPVLAHATAAPPTAMYPGSPMLMHVPPPGVTPQTRPPYPPPPGSLGMGRGSLPVTNPMDPRSQPVAPGPGPAPPHHPHPPAAPGSRFSVHNSVYNPVVPPQSITRPW